MGRGLAARGRLAVERERPGVVLRHAAAGLVHPGEVSLCPRDAPVRGRLIPARGLRIVRGGAAALLVHARNLELRVDHAVLGGAQIVAEGCDIVAALLGSARRLQQHALDLARLGGVVRAAGHQDGQQEQQQSTRRRSHAHVAKRSSHYSCFPSCVGRGPACALSAAPSPLSAARSASSATGCTTASISARAAGSSGAGASGRDAPRQRQRRLDQAQAGHRRIAEITVDPLEQLRLAVLQLERSGSGDVHVQDATMATAAAGQLDRLAARREGLADDARPVGQHARLGEATAARGRIEHLAEQVGQAPQPAAAAHRLAARGALPLASVAHPGPVVHRARSSPNRRGTLLLARGFLRIVSGWARGTAQTSTIYHKCRLATNLRGVPGDAGPGDRPPARLVRPASPAAAVAGPARAPPGSLSRALERGHAAADHGGDRGGALRGVSGAVSEPDRARGRRAGRRPACLAGPRLLSARARPARLRRGGRPAVRWRIAAQRGRAARAARHRRLHRAGDPRHRVRPADGAGGCQRRARARAPARHRDAAAGGAEGAAGAGRRAGVAAPAGRRRPGLDGPRRHGVPAAPAALRGVPLAVGLHRACRRQRRAAAAACRKAASGRCGVAWPSS